MIDFIHMVEERIDSKMESLASEVTMGILSRVPILDLPKLRYVCKSWNNILNHPLFHRLHECHWMSKPNENRVLILKRSSELYMVQMSDKTNPRMISIDLPCALDHYEFIGSCNGLLCLGSEQASSIFIINPFTRQHKFFPINIEVISDVWSWGFGYDEFTKSFKVVVIGASGAPPNYRFKVGICQLSRKGNTNWRDTVVIPAHGKIRACFFNRRLHWAYWNNQSIGIVSFNLANEEFRSIPIPGDLLFNTISFDLIVLGGCLCIFHSPAITTPGSVPPKLQIWVMKEYGVKESWVKELDTLPRLPGSLDPRVRLDRKFFQGLGCIKDGELVVSRLSFDRREEVILFSDSICDEYKLLQLDRPPNRNGSIIHTLSLNWI